MVERDVATIDTIIIHCAATGGDVDAETINEWHLQRGWSMIGYHHVIRFDGTVQVGRLHRQVGAHCRGHNKTSIGICLAGGKNPNQGYTSAQWFSLADLCRELMNMYEIATIAGHNDFTYAKTCPNFDVKHWSSTL